jgi:hypothetical protein
MPTAGAGTGWPSGSHNGPSGPIQLDGHDPTCWNQLGGVLHVMGADDPAVCYLVDVVRPDRGLATGRRDAEQLSGVDAVQLGAHADHSVSVVGDVVCC